MKNLENAFSGESACECWRRDPAVKFGTGDVEMEFSWENVLFFEECDLSSFENSIVSILRTLAML